MSRQCIINPHVGCWKLNAGILNNQPMCIHVSHFLSFCKHVEIKNSFIAGIPQS